MSRIDPHSYADDAQPRTRHLRWKMDVDFASNRITGEVTFELAASGSGPFDLDTKGLEILGATVDGKSIPHELAPEVEILGRRLRLASPPVPPP